MKRNITAQLIKWKESKYRKPLILQGARQVGKTYSVLDFGRNHYENVVYVNLEIKEVRRLFDDSLDPGALIPKISNFTRKTITKGNTLLFLDEIQACPHALTSLKYFCELAPEYHVIAAGSLLGVALNREEYSFPVGKVNMLTLYSMDIEEFLLATIGDELVSKIVQCFNDDTPMDSYYHDFLLEQYRKYLVVGGLPECVSKFCATGDYELVRVTQNEILSSYLNDMSKYNSASEIKKTRLVYNSITTQLSKKNTRFQYKLVKKGGRAAEFENAIEWLVLAGIVMRVYNLDMAKKPLDNYKNIDSFKIFISDVGLLSASKNIIAEDILYRSPELSDFMGGMTENYVCRQLFSQNHACYSWHSEGLAEIDFVLQRDRNIIPIEVKSATNNQAKSLSVYIKRFKPEYAIKISANNFGFENGIKTIPLYAAFCI